MNKYHKKCFHQSVLVQSYPYPKQETAVARQWCGMGGNTTRWWANINNSFKTFLPIYFSPDFELWLCTQVNSCFYLPQERFTQQLIMEKLETWWLWHVMQAAPQQPHYPTIFGTAQFSTTVPFKGDHWLKLKHPLQMHLKYFLQLCLFPVYKIPAFKFYWKSYGCILFEQCYFEARVDSN